MIKNIYNKFKLSRKHLLLTGIAIGIATAASCLKKTDLQVDDLGEAVAAETIADTLGQAFGDLTYTNMKTNEMTDIVVSEQVEAGAIQNLEEQNITIKAINDQPGYLEIQSHSIMTSFSGSGNVTDERDWDQYFPKYSGFAFSMGNSANSAATAQAISTASESLPVHQQSAIHQSDSTDLSAPIYTFKLVQSLALASCFDGGTYPETCHNLSVVDIDYRVPAVSAPQHNCTDIYNCFIKAKQIEFDLLQKYNLDSDGKPRRVHYSLIISQAVPYTSRVLSYCTRSLYDVPGVNQKVLADMCYKVNKYSFGTP